MFCWLLVRTHCFLDDMYDFVLIWVGFCRMRTSSVVTFNSEYNGIYNVQRQVLEAGARIDFLPV